MKRVLCVLFAILLCMSLFTACKEDKKEQPPVKKQVVSQVETKPEQEKAEEQENELPFEGTKTFMFTSGVGGWYTELILESDGSFTGNYHDSDMGSGGEGYQGTYYYCDFEGYFEKVEKIDDYSYKLYLGELTAQDAGKEPWIEDETLMVPSVPYGMEECDMFVLYLPGTDIRQHPEEFLSWWNTRYIGETLKTELDCYGLHNTTHDYGLFSYDE